MLQKISSFLDRFSEFYAHRKGLFQLLGLGLVVLNFVFELLPATWFSQTDLFLHLGVVLAIIGFLLARAL